MTHFPFKDVQIICHIQYLTFLLSVSTGHHLIIQSNAYRNDNNVKKNSAGKVPKEWLILNACSIKILEQKQYWEKFKIIVVGTTWKWGTAWEKAVWSKMSKESNFFPDEFQNMKGLPLWKCRFRWGGCSQDSASTPATKICQGFRLQIRQCPFMISPLEQTSRALIASCQWFSGNTFEGKGIGYRDIPGS